MVRKQLGAALAMTATVFALVPVSSALADAVPSTLKATAVAPAIASDGVTGIVATLRKADGSLYDGAPLEVKFFSACAANGRALLQQSALTSEGVAAVTYRPQGCVGVDQVTASISGNPALSSTLSLSVSSAGKLSAKGLLGRAMYFDIALSASGKMSCASCHSPAENYQDPDFGPTPLGGVTGQAVGFRTAPTASYAALIPRFAWLTTKTAATTGRNGSPHGGLMWDGRAATLGDQARGPFVMPHEMANTNTAGVLAKLLARPYAAAFSKAYGPVSAGSNPDTVVAEMADAIATFERQDPSFRLFSSKYDRVQSGQASFTLQERNGQSLFFDPNRGGCAGCHSSIGAQQTTKPPPQLFSDETYRALGVPRNWALPYNDDSRALAALSELGLASLANGSAVGAPEHVYYDLGVCGPFRTDSLLDPPLCGTFKVPTLRNVALKHAYEHNGVFGSLSAVVNFYDNRDIQPGQFYVTRSGGADIRYNDLPLQFQANVQQRVPFRPFPGGAPRLTAADIQDLVAFLCTLTDGYDVNNPAAYRLPAQCLAARR